MEDQRQGVTITAWLFAFLVAGFFLQVVLDRVVAQVPVAYCMHHGGESMRIRATTYSRYGSRWSTTQRVACRDGTQERFIGNTLETLQPRGTAPTPISAPDEQAH